MILKFINDPKNSRVVGEVCAGVGTPGWVRPGGGDNPRRDDNVCSIKYPLHPYRWPTFFMIKDGEGEGDELDSDSV